MSGTHTSDPCAGEACLVPPAEFVRLRYFFGQRLGVVDLADEQSYLVGKQRFHNLSLHGAGVLCGLRAERYAFPRNSAVNQPTTLLRVRRGAALDECGREIVVGWDQCIDVAAWYAQHPGAKPAASPGSAGPTSLRLWVALCYRECPSDPAPAPRDPCGCDAGGCEFARIREGFELKLLTDAEALLISSHGRSPASFELSAETVLGGPPDGAWADAAALRAGADCPTPPADPCLLLAHFEATLDAAGAKLVNLAAPDNAIPERRSLLPTAMLQQGLLQALAAIGDAGLLGPGPRFAAATFAAEGAGSGTLSIGILTDGADLARDPLAAPAQLKLSVYRFKDDGKWEKAPAFTGKYVPTPSPRIDLKWPSGLVADGRYRVLIESDRVQPPVDTLMRPIAPPFWVRHFRLIQDSAGNLVLADSLYP